ncbi:hypothetical protein [Streptomyces sp. CoT10]|uniref:hypothetical protein n=1 Tax=Streptomyces sp. CoT10 TaxID=2875762 RepID=UPI001CD67005|nr:hypothetical protein [Streptomyces sp. CoT10]
MTERPTDAQTPLVFLIGGRGTRRLEPLGYDGLVRMFARACTGAKSVLRATATAEIEATAPIERVVQQLEELAEH